MLQLTSTINQAYCRAWKCDYWIVRGIPFQLDDDSLVTERLVIQGRKQRPPTTSTKNDPCGRSTSSASDDATLSSTSVPRVTTTRTSTTIQSIPASRSTYNKVAILEMVLAHNNNNNKDDVAAVQYDRLLLLDADAMLYDFDHDIATAIPIDRVVAAHRTHRNTTTTTTSTTTASTNTGSINVGVTVWNLRHPLTGLLVQKWKARCLARIVQHKHDDDQAPLQQLLKHMPDPARDRVVYALDETLGYAQGRWVKHFIRRSNDWLPPASSSQPNNDDNNSAAAVAAVRGDERRMQITHAVCEVCQRYWPVCQEQSEENRRIDSDNGTGTNVSM